jgi:hypothetical protein
MRASLLLLATLSTSCAALLGIEDSTLDTDSTPEELTGCSGSSTCCVTLSGDVTASVECSVSYATFETTGSKLSLELGAGDASDGEAPYLIVFVHQMPGAPPSAGAHFTDVAGSIDFRLVSGDGSAFKDFTVPGASLSFSAAEMTSTDDTTDYYDVTGTLDATAEGVTVQATFAP